MVDKVATKRHFNTLTGLVKALEGYDTVIDLRNESCVCGKIVHVDGNMNVDLKNAYLYDNRGKQHAFSDFFVNSRIIRYVHIPDKLSPVELLEGLIATMRNKPKEKRSHTFKRVRAERYQQETLRTAFK